MYITICLVHVGTRNIEVVNLLLDAGVDVNQKNMLGMNSLLLVSGYGNDHLVKTILNAGADPNATNNFNHTALHLAIVGKRDQIKKMKKMGFPEALEADKVCDYFPKIEADKVCDYFPKIMLTDSPWRLIRYAICFVR